MEQQTPVAYWEEIYNRYETWIDSFDACPVLRLNVNDYFLLENPLHIEAIIGRIGRFLE